MGNKIVQFKLRLNEKLRYVHFFIKYEVPKYSLIIFFTGLFLGVLIVVLILDIYDNQFSYHDILVEANGLVLDILILGLGLTIFEYFRSKREQITNLQMRIDDYRGWKSDEAKHRIMGSVNRLIELGIYQFNLNSCFLVGSDFSDTNYSGTTFLFSTIDNSSFIRANLTNSSFIGASVKESYFTLSTMNNTNFMSADLQNSFLTSINLHNCELSRVNLSEANIIDCIFENCNFTDANLNNTIVDLPDWLEQLNFQNNKGIEQIQQKYYVDLQSVRQPDGFPIYTIRER